MAPSGSFLPQPGQHDLFRGVVKEEHVSIPLSAAGQQATRLAATRDGSFVFSTGPSVFKLCCSPTRKRTRRTGTTQGNGYLTQQTNPADSELGGEAVVSATADDYIVPKPFSNVSVERLVPHCAHQSEVQSVTAEETRIASVDMYGRCIVTAEKASQPVDGSDTAGDLDQDADSFVLPPITLSGGDPGWAGVALRRKDPTSTVVARQFFRDVTIFDRDVPIRTIHPILQPSAIGFCGESSLVAVAEGPGVSFYDFRAAERGCCVGRKTAGSGQLLALDVSPDGAVLAAAGFDRTVHIFDTRTMTVRDRWPGCLKYECAGTVLSQEMDGMAYVCSVDNEVACGAWSTEMAGYLKAALSGTESLMISGANTKSPRRAFGFRGDVRLTGMARRNLDGEEIAALSEAGAFYLLRRSKE